MARQASWWRDGPDSPSWRRAALPSGGMCGRGARGQGPCVSCNVSNALASPMANHHD